MASGHAQKQEEKYDVELPEPVEYWLDVVVRGKNAESTYKKRRSNLRTFWRFCEQELGIEDIHEVQFRHVQRYLSKADEEGKADSTIQGRYYSLNRYFKHAIKMGNIDENPCRDISLIEWIDSYDATRKDEELKDDLHFIEPEEKEQLLEHVPKPTLRNELIIKLLWQTGMRQEELCSIKLRDIDHKEQNINIRSDKEHKNRTVWYHPHLESLMQQWIDIGRKSYTVHAESDYLFLTPKKEQMKPEIPNKKVKQAAEGAGIQATMYEDSAGMKRHKVTGHTLRHSYAVQSLKNGMDVRTLQKLMGHKHIEQTAKYLKYGDETIKDMQRRYGAGVESV